LVVVLVVIVSTLQTYNYILNSQIVDKVFLIFLKVFFPTIKKGRPTDAPTTTKQRVPVACIR